MIYQASSDCMQRVMIFVADVHIRPDSKEDKERFISWINKAKRGNQTVFILGDLFDYWFTGIEHCTAPVMEALAAANIHILPGNRDFLITNCSVSGISILKEEEIITTPTLEKVLITHGHTLTLDDYGFKFLHAFGWPVLRLLDRSLPDFLKERLARFLVKSSAVIRPPRAAIEPDTARRKGVDMVICGHLHRMITSGHLIVLPSFFDSGQWLVWDEGGPRMESECSALLKK